MKFCIDTNIFINGIKRTGESDKIERAKYFFEWVDTNKHEIIIPTVVIAEVLAPEPLEKYPVYMEVITTGFIVADFDTRAATRYSQIMMNRIEEIKKIAEENGIIRNKMKIDHQIIACALVHGADRIYSNDNGVKSFGNHFIEVWDLPMLPAKQNTLFS